MCQICMTKLHEPSVKSLTKFQMWICIGITRFQPQDLMKVNLTAPLDIPNLNFLLNDSLKKPCKQCLVHILQQNFDFTGAYPWWLEKFETQLYRESVFMWFQAETVRLAVLLREAFIVQLEMSFSFSQANDVKNLRQNIIATN